MEEPKEGLGGGSGGGPSADQVSDVTGAYHIQANQVELLGRPPLPPAVPGPCVVSVVAAGLIPGDGRVEVRGTQGVRITTGPLCLPPTSSDSTNGVEIVVFESQNITIQRGLLPEIDQKIEMTPEGITIDAGMTPLTIKSLTQITLSVAEGLASITIGPQGVQIKGLLIQIN